MKLRFQQGDISAQANPPAGQFVVMYDTDGKLKQKDSSGVITEIGSGGTSGPLPIETDYPTTTPLKAGQKFLYKGNEWHYMTQEEIDSTGWTGLVDVGFPAPVRKVFDHNLFYSGAIIVIYQSYPRLPDFIDNHNCIVDFLGLGNPAIYRSCFPNVPATITQFKNARLLGNLEDIGTSTGLVIYNLGLTDSVINDFFTQLPTTLKTVTIDVRYNPGSATCDPSIATSKGYTVITSD